MKSVTSGDDVALHGMRGAVVPKSEQRLGRREVRHLDVTGLEQETLALGDCRGDQVLDELVLAIHRDRTPAGEVLEVDVVIPTANPKKNAAMDQALAAHALTDADAFQQRGCVVLEHSG